MNKNSSSICDSVLFTFPATTSFDSVTLNTFSSGVSLFAWSTYCPSNTISLSALTSPLILNVVAVVNLSALPALPLTVPLTLPVKLPINVVAYAFANFAVELPKFLVLLPSGNMFAVVSTPVSCVAPRSYVMH